MNTSSDLEERHPAASVATQMDLTNNQVRRFARATRAIDERPWRSRQPRSPVPCQDGLTVAVMPPRTEMMRISFSSLPKLSADIVNRVVLRVCSSRRTKRRSSARTMSPTGSLRSSTLGSRVGTRTTADDGPRTPDGRDGMTPITTRYRRRSKELLLTTGGRNEDRAHQREGRATA